MSETATALPAGPDLGKLFTELEVPFPANVVLWRVTNTSNSGTRGRVIPYADPRAYTDRLNSLLTPKGWTREYKVETINNVTRTKRTESVITGKILVTCTVTILGVGSHSGTGEEWADDDNAMTSAEAQAFKRACSCFGLGRYFYDVVAPWVDLDDYKQPKRIPPLPVWGIPENWRKGMRPGARNAEGEAAGAPQSKGAEQNGRINGKLQQGSAGTNGSSQRSGTNVTNGTQAGNRNSTTTQPSTNSSRTNGQGGNGNGSQSNARSTNANGNGNGSGSHGGNGNNGSDLDARIIRMEKIVGPQFYRGILREYGRVNQPKLIRDVQVKGRVLQMLEAGSRGFGRLDAVIRRLDSATVESLLAKLQAPPLNEIADMKTLQDVVYGLEGLTTNGPHATQ